ncbi:HAMP domain-containing sensor histidine kinase [Kribbella sp. NPDC006257]|uniref:sensor histidine kinase n=1 Tax=Kribbella sp. NPDC006257 TaxID=3156738 RepID=UPI0033BB3BBA
MTLRLRLTLIYGGLFMAAGVLLLGLTYALFNQQLSSGDHVIIKGTYLSPPASGATTGPQPVPPKNVVVLNNKGDVLTGPDAERAMNEQRDQLRSAATKSLLTQGGIALLLVGALAAGSGWLVAGRVLAPLHRVTDTARRIALAPAAGRGLHERIALRGPDDEVKNLADAFDTMVERLDHSFDGQRRFVANASHELRTPLTLGRALVEVAMHRRSASEDVKQLGESLLEINRRHEQLISGLLILADSEKELTARYPVNLADVVSHVVAQLANEAAASDVVVRADAGDAPTTGDALLLERLVHNLVENAIRHNHAGGWVEVRSRTVGPGEVGTGGAGWVEVEVVNSGADVPAYEVEGLFKPFHRLRDDRLVAAKGAGLGLSIVRSVAEAHGGSVRASPRDGGGLTIVVTLPVDPG